jgi:hypothetical protein
MQKAGRRTDPGPVPVVPSWLLATEKGTGSRTLPLGPGTGLAVVVTGAVGLGAARRWPEVRREPLVPALWPGLPSELITGLGHQRRNIFGEY